MNTKDKERVSELVIDEWIWGVFIILSILNITGDEFEKKSYKYPCNGKSNILSMFFLIFYPYSNIIFY